MKYPKELTPLILTKDMEVKKKKPRKIKVKKRRQDFSIGSDDD